MSKSSRSSEADDTNKDEDSDDDVYKASDFDSTLRLDAKSGYNPDSDSEVDEKIEDLSDNDSTDEMLAKREEGSSFHTVRREVMKPHKPLVGVDFDPSWNKKIGAVEKTAKPAERCDDSPAEEVESEKEEHESDRDHYSSYSSVEESYESEYDVPSDFESDTPSEPEEEKDRLKKSGMTKTNLSSEVFIEYPDTYDLGPIQAVPWSQGRMVSEMKDNCLSYLEKLCSEIYLLVDKFGNKKVLVFNQSDEALVTFSVKISYDEKGAGCIYEARIKNKLHWVKRVAECQGDQIKFHATELESFYIIKIPQKESMTITPQGNTLSFQHTGAVSLVVPSQTVSKPQPVSMQLNAVDKHAMQQRHRLFPDKFKLQKVSQRLFIEHNIPEFSKPFSLKLELETFRDDVDSDYLEPVAIFWKEGEPTIKSNAECSLQTEANKVMMTVKNFPNKSGLSIGLASSGDINEEEAKLAYSDAFLCKLVIHIKIVKPQEAMVYINCVMIENLQKIQERFQSIWMIGASEDIYLKNFQRIRVHLLGNSIRKKSHKQKIQNCFIMFSNRAKDNCLSFIIEKDSRMGVSPSTILEFSLDSGSKKKIHRQEFDPWVLVGMKPGSGVKNPALKLTRGQTNLDFMSSRPATNK